MRVQSPFASFRDSSLIRLLAAGEPIRKLQSETISRTHYNYDFGSAPRVCAGPVNVFREFDAAPWG